MEEKVRTMARLVLRNRENYPSTQAERKAMYGWIWEDIISRPGNNLTFEDVVRFTDEEINFNVENNQAD